MIMSQCVVPNWNMMRHQRQEQVEGEERRNKSSHVHNQQNPGHVVPLSDYEVTELTWENGQLAMHGLGGLLPSPMTKPTWGSSGDTLESIVHQGTYHNENINLVQHHRNPANMSSVVASSGGKWSESSGKMQMDLGFVKKRTRSNSDQSRVNFSSSMLEEYIADRSACASASTTFGRDNDTTTMTWASFESPQSFKTKNTDEDSACHGGSENQEGERETRPETGHSNSTRRRAAAIHNQSERRRRDRINQKMKALQKLVPNASKTDKASMLDEVIEYLKQLQAQLHMMSTVRNMPQMMMPLEMQQQIQMSQFLARMGMAGVGVGVGVGMGMGMLDMSTMARSAPQPLPPLIRPTPVAAATPSFVPPPFMVPPMIPTQTPPRTNAGAAINTPVPFNNPYCAFLAQQSMNMDLYNKMAALYRQQVNQSPQATSSPLQPNHLQGDSGS